MYFTVDDPTMSDVTRKDGGTRPPGHPGLRKLGLISLNL